MKVLFVYPNSTKSREVALGIAYLSGMLRNHGYETGLLDLTWNPSLDEIIRAMKGYDLLAISCGTLEYKICLNTAKIWKKHYELPIVVGGPHATVMPEEAIKESNVDAVCVGEGEEALLEFVEGCEEKATLPTNVRNFWVKEGDKIHKNPLRPLVEDLDRLPFPDRSIFDLKHIHGPNGCSFLTARGCPFNCRMCINHRLQRLYRGLGKYTRFRSVDNLFQEIQEVKRVYSPKRLLFSDDTFTINKPRLEEFCIRYPKEVGIPFIIMGRCNTVTKTMLANLKRANCIQIGYGLESGNDFIRNTILRRRMSTAQIVDAFKWTNELGIKTVSFNMIGIPLEDRKTIFDTINLNRLVKPNIVQTTLLYPFPKTDIEDLAQRNNLLQNNPSMTDYYNDSVVKIHGMTRHDLFSLSIAMPFYIHMPRFFHPLIRLMEASMAILRRLGHAKLVVRGIAKTRRMLENVSTTTQ